MKRVLFLHLPKTAGQSVHQFLVDTYGEDNVCPARVNDQLVKIPLDKLECYSVFSGHLDWNHFDSVKGELFTFTILRDPLDRLLSFYFYLREQAIVFKKRGELDSKPGLKATLENTPQEYFVDKKNVHRAFIDENYDNFYTYYFAGRSYSARNELNRMVGSGKIFRSVDRLVDLAKSNISHSADSVYSIHEWSRELAIDLDVNSIADDNSYALNKGRTKHEDRLKLLTELGADNSVFERLHDMCKLDYKLLDRLEIVV